MPPTITVLSSMATRGVLADLAAAYERRHDVPVSVTSVGGVDAARRVRAGEVVDVVILAEPVMAALESEGHLAAGGRVTIARSSMALAVPAGRPRPALTDEAAVRAAISTAGRIAYSTGPSGDHMMRLLDAWGLIGIVRDRLVLAPPGIPVGGIVARGEADIGVQQLSELVDVAGIEVAGILPAELGTDTLFQAARTTAAPDAERAASLIRLLVSADAGPLLRARGLRPG